VAIVPGTDRVLAEYTGGREDLFSTRGPATRVRYYVSARAHERQILVYVEDLPGLVGSGEWRPVEGWEEAA
jgi:hypothetical protein